jgi:transposase
LRHSEIEPNGENATSEELKVAMEAAPTKRSYIRLGAIRLLLEGWERPQVCTIYNRSDRMVRLWIEMFNRGGIDALASKPRSGRPAKIQRARLRDLLVPVLEDPSKAGELHWTGVKLHGFLKEQLQIELSYRTLINYLHELNYNLRVPRPWPERQNEQQRKAFLEKLRSWQEDPLSCGLPTSVALRAIRARGGAGAPGAAGKRCLISETISEPMSSAQCVRLAENAAR